MIVPSAPSSYDRANEQQARNAFSQAFAQTVRGDVAITRLLMIDQDTGETVSVTVESGVLVVT